MYNIPKEHYFLENFTYKEKDNIAINFFMDIFRYLVWQDKLEKGYPAIN
jgi:hypothetical protein